MYRDNSLIPKEAIRMAALGTLVSGDKRYRDIAGDVSEFTSRFLGPSLELLGTSIEMLKLEGLIATVASCGDTGDDILTLTPNGKRALLEYLQASIRMGGSDLNKLVIALKLRFIDLLENEEKLTQIEILVRMYKAERARLKDLVNRNEWSDGLLIPFVNSEIDLVEKRIDWCEQYLMTFDC